jgi:hypothetical protein
MVADVPANLTIVTLGSPTSPGPPRSLRPRPDGHPWEIAHAPGFPLDDRGRIGIGG